MFEVNDKVMSPQGEAVIQRISGRKCIIIFANGQKRIMELDKLRLIKKGGAQDE